MIKTVDERISYYLKKVVELGNVRPFQEQPKAQTFRHERLMQYKERLNQLCYERKRNG